MGVAAVLTSGNATYVERAREFLEGLTTWEARVAATALLLVVTLLLAVVVLPRVKR